eukprot:761980-Alexandrium_andersonii.AAC.1
MEGGIDVRGRNLRTYVVKHLNKAGAMLKPLWKPKLGGGSGATKDDWSEWVEDCLLYTSPSPRD